jgi:hypothetical protein
MTVPQSSPHWAEILNHFLDGTPLSEAARAYYLSDPACVAAVTEQLSRAVPTGAASYRATRGGELPEAARLALGKAREMLKREFGIDRGQSE